MSAARCSLSAALVALLCAAPASAQTYRLRADAFAQAPDPTAFVMLSAQARTASPVLVDAEAMVWAGFTAADTTSPEPDGEAVLVSVRLRDRPLIEKGVARSSLWEVRLGRQIFSAGAIRPLYFDGAVAAAHAPSGTGLEVFGGVPVALGFDGRSYDWLLGQRFSQSLGEYGRVGLSYYQQRDEGRVAFSELGVDAALTPFDMLALSGSAAVDLDRVALAQARVSATLHGHVNRLELFGLRRSPDHLLPATSLFAALGAYDADALGMTGFWRPAPRLDLSATATVERVSDKPAATQSLRADLRLDERGAGVIGVDVRRESVPDASWTGARAWATVPFAGRFAIGAEGEVAFPDEPRDRGALWPWGLLTARYRPVDAIEIVGGVEAGASPSETFSLGGLLRVSGMWSR